MARTSLPKIGVSDSDVTFWSGAAQIAPPTTQPGMQEVHRVQKYLHLDVRCGVCPLHYTATQAPIADTCITNAGESAAELGAEGSCVLRFQSP